MPGVFARLVRSMGLAVLLVAAATGTGGASPAAGAVISNTVTAQYNDPTGLTYGAQSNTVTVSVAAVSSVAVAPKEPAVDPNTESFPFGTPVTRTFTITNSGNVPDAYTLASLTASAGTITSIAFVTASGAIPATVGSSVSPALQPGESINVQVVIATAGVVVATPFSIALVARSTNAATANGVVTDNGRGWAVAQPRASIAGPNGPNTIVAKLVNHKRSHPAHPGETVTYSIAFRNYGGSPATNVVVVDDIPTGVHPLLPTVALNGAGAASSATLAGQRLTVRVGTMAVNESDVITFDAVVDNALSAGSSYVNVAAVSADGIASATTAPASVFIGVGNVVYDGYAGGGSPITGATLTLRDLQTHAVADLPKTAAQALARTPLDVLTDPAGLPPNTANANPFTTGGDGAYSFVFSQAQLGTPAVPVQYELDISAPGYRDRRVAITITPDATGLLYTAMLSALDDQQLARAGGFELVTTNVSLSEVFGLLGNQPMFTSHPLTVSKTVDRDVASGGDRLLYTVQVGSQGAEFGATRVVDTLPAGVVYAPGTARVDGVPVEPHREGRILTWTFPALAAQHSIMYACVVMPFTADGSTLINVVDVDTSSGGGLRVHGSATADTRVVAGALGNRIVVTGRVFVDAARTGRFRDGDKGVPGVRVFLEDGESVTTDRYGRFTFPSVHPGQHVLRVDTTTLPVGVRAYDDRRYDSPRSLQRLLHGIYDAGLMHDVNFALEPAA
ncbi:MAG TPA: hypothetical protein VGC72_10515 [Candidatus Elarobacter sp.]|jgi:uncharacterized repeat protein (TIGR01451 family)